MSSYFQHVIPVNALTPIRWWKQSPEARKCQNSVSFVSTFLVQRFSFVAVLGDALATYDQNKGKIFTKVIF